MENEEHKKPLDDKVHQFDGRRESGDADFVIPVDEHFEEVSEGGKTVRRRGIFLLPNLITTAALFSGFYAIIAGMNGDFQNAAIAIFAAMIFDGLDGRVARITNTSSAFGVEYDSLSDMVSFGLAPALVMFNWALAPLGKYGWAVAFAYTACAALRLARFNTQVASVDKRYFVGLSSPAAAAIVAGTVWVGFLAEVEISFIGAILTLASGLLMVSNIEYQSFKGVDLKGRVPFVKLILGVLLFVFIVSNPAVNLLILAATYGVSGPAMWVWKRAKAKPKKES